MKKSFTVCSILFYSSFFLLSSCANFSSLEKLSVKKVLEAYLVPAEMVFCDDSVGVESSCFLFFEGKKYLKSRQIKFSFNRDSYEVDMFKPEGILSFSKSELQEDHELKKSFGYIINDSNLVDVVDETIVYSDQKFTIISRDNMQKIFYCRMNNMSANDTLKLILFYY